jgi:hypothetical protein
MPGVEQAFCRKVGTATLRAPDKSGVGSNFRFCGTQRLLNRLYGQEQFEFVGQGNKTSFCAFTADFSFLLALVGLSSRESTFRESFWESRMIDSRSITRWAS